MGKRIFNSHGFCPSFILWNSPLFYPHHTQKWIIPFPFRDVTHQRDTYKPMSQDCTVALTKKDYSTHMDSAPLLYYGTNPCPHYTQKWIIPFPFRDVTHQRGTCPHRIVCRSDCSHCRTAHPVWGRGRRTPWSAPGSRSHSCRCTGSRVPTPLDHQGLKIKENFYSLKDYLSKLL